MQVPGSSENCPRRSRRQLALAAAALLLEGALRANDVLDWNALMLDAIRLDSSPPTLASRNLAILHAALFDAVNSVTGECQPYRYTVPAAGDAAPEAAALAAGREVLLTLYPSLLAATDDHYVTRRAALPDTAATTNGLAVGRTAARWLLEARSADGANTHVPYTPSPEPGQWRRTPPFFRPPVDPHWRFVDLFALPDMEPFLPPPPPPLESDAYAAAFNEVKELGRKDSATRTAEQSQIARFWSDFSYTATPPGHWQEMAADLARERGLSLADSARLLALLGLAQADSAIVCWEAKYRYNFWRPVTAIQRADEDGNPATTADPAWDHFLAAPSFPEHTSGHSTFSKASAEVLTRWFGTDAVSFSARSDALPGVTRTFTSFAACAEEIGRSRIYGGIHFETANRAGKLSGQRIGAYVSANFLLPNAGLPLVRLEQKSPALTTLRVHGHLGRSCRLEASADLEHWTPLLTGTAVAGGLIVHDTDAVPVRFYRVVEP